MSSSRVVILMLLLVAGLATFAELRNRGIAATTAPALPPEVRSAAAMDAEDPPEVAIGERLFRETRFSQFYFANAGANVNARLRRGDPVLDRTVTASGDLPGAFAGEAMSCRACHLVGEHASARSGSRAYADFAGRSPIPMREDGLTTTVRNSPAAVNATLARADLLLHFDGEFASAEDLARETILGRNYGWLPPERAVAMRHVARVVREDDGAGSLAQEFGGAYRRILRGDAPDIPERLRLPPEFRIDLSRASDEEVVGAVARLIAAYLESLVFEQDTAGVFSASPYDVFLESNGLPRAPMSGESRDAYGRRLLAALETLDRPRWVEAREDSFRLHDQEFAFGPRELDGLRIFLTRPGAKPGARSTARAANCVACHPPPAFTDFRFHNTGAAESEYESIHGSGAFAALPVPDLATRNADFDAWLPPTPHHPNARGPYLAVPERGKPGRTDLGAWNVVGNPDLPRPQAALRALLGRPGGAESLATLAARAVGCFKTPGLRDLGHSEPYLHTGRGRTLEDVLAHYVEFSARARARTMRNPDPEMARVHVTGADAAALAAFLRSLNEDYE